jgi:4-amino-4-deoxy-L-arabinose transferase-like glycosyltransferase
MNTERRSSWLVFLALMAALLLLATQRPLALPDEGRYGEIGRWMLQSGDFLAPRLDGLPFFHKPPLLHWLQSGAYAVLGASAWSARFIPALHAGLMLLGLYLSVRHVEGEAQARRAMLVLGSSLGFLIGGQYVNHDMLVAAWISAAIWCMGAAFMHGDRPDTRLALLGFAACAFGVLSKGLIGIVLPGMVILAWLLYTGQTRKMLALPWLRGLAVFAAIALPWFILGQRKYPELFNYLIIGQHFARYTGQTFNNQWPFWFYLIVLPALMFPWGLLFVAWLRPSGFKAAIAQDRRSPAVQWSSLLWIWLGVILLFFSLPKSKIVGYILPVLPPAAALVARTWNDWHASERLKNRLFAGLLIASLLLSVVANHLAGQHTLRKHSSRDVALLLGCALQPAERVYAAGAYPYDLPFYARVQEPVRMVEDWAAARLNSGDNWRRELFEAGDFEPEVASTLLLPPSVLNPAPANAWLVTPRDFAAPTLQGAWQNAYQGQNWTLWLAAGSAPEGPPAAQQERLARCQQQGQH